VFFFDGVTITGFLKDSSIDRFASIIGINSAVRRKLAAMQHEIARNRDVIVDGRDAGSVVFPNAEYKFYITASAEERARRWQKQQAELGHAISLEHAHACIKERDNRDEKRKHSPLIVPVGAHVIDTTALTIDEVLRRLLCIIKK
jgi:cytidylate kinase